MKCTASRGRSPLLAADAGQAPLRGELPARLALRAVHRAAAELRRGTPVLLTGSSTLVLLAAETAQAGSVAEFMAVCEGPPLLLLSPVRAAAVLGQPEPPTMEVVALRLPERLLTPEMLRALADVTAHQPRSARPEQAPAPSLAPAALALAKLGRLLPAVLAAPFRADAADLGARLGLLSVSAGDVLAYPKAAASALRRVAEARVPLDGAEDARVVAFRADAGTEHLAILVGQPDAAEAPLVRLHSECFTGDLLGSLRCDCGPQLRGAIRRMTEEGAGALLYLAQEGRGIGLVSKLRAYALQDQGLDTLEANRALGWEADERDFMAAATMLDLLGIRRIRLLTNNPGKIAALAACGVEVVGRERHVFAPNGINDHYLATKAERFGHLLR
jgi:GTP cyclohydrolase II